MLMEVADIWKHVEKEIQKLVNLAPLVASRKMKLQ